MQLDAGKLNQIMLEKGISRQELSYRTDIPINTLWYYQEGGRKDITEFRLRELADAIGVDPFDLVTEETKRALGK